MKTEPLLIFDSNNLVAKENNVIKVSKGPQFKTKGGTVLAMIFLMFLILSLALLFKAEFFVALICIFISMVIFSLVLDIHGIELDTGKHKIRDYKAFLWFKIGEWSNINDFKSIYLTQKNVTTRTSVFSGGSADTYHYYHIKLVDELNNKEILLAEYKNYYKALKISRNVAEATGLIFKDFLRNGKKRK